MTRWIWGIPLTVETAAGFVERQGFRPRNEGHSSSKMFTTFHAVLNKPGFRGVNIDLVFDWPKEENLFVLSFDDSSTRVESRYTKKDVDVIRDFLEIAEEPKWYPSVHEFDDDDIDEPPLRSK